MEFKNSPTKQHYEKNAKKFVIKRGSQTLHRKCECRYSQYINEYCDFDTFEEVKNSGLEFNKCRYCFKLGMDPDAPSSFKNESLNNTNSLNKNYNNSEKNLIFNLGSKILHKKGCSCAGLSEYCMPLSLHELMNSNINFRYCHTCRPQDSIPDFPTEKEIMLRKGNIERQYNNYWIIRLVGLFFTVISVLFFLVFALTFEPEYTDDFLSISSMISVLVLLILFGIPCLLWARNIKKKYREHFTDKVKQEYKETKKRIIIICIIVLTISILLITILPPILRSSKKSSIPKDPYDYVWEKDPNTWTEKEKDYVNDFFEWQEEHNK